MTHAAVGRPVADEYIPYYGQYIRLVPDGDVVEILAHQIEETTALLAAFTPAQAAWRPAPGEWNALQIVGHLADTERVLAYRALRFARDDATPLPGVDFEAYVPAAGFERRAFADVVAEYAAVRPATVALFRSLDAAAWTRRGLADGQAISVRALAFALAGHELHHLLDLRQYAAAAGTA